MRWRGLVDFPCSIAPIVVPQTKHRMSQMADLHAICIVRPAHMGTVQLLVAPCRIRRIVDTPATAVSAIEVLRHLDCIAPDFAVHHTGRLVRSHKLAVPRLAPSQRARKHLVILADT